MTVELQLAFVPDNKDSYIIPVRVGIDGACATIETAAGNNVPAAVSSALHRALIERVVRALNATLEPSRLKAVTATIMERASAPGQPQHSDMYGPEISAAVGATDSDGTPS